MLDTAEEAGERLFITQQSLGKTIRDLKEELAVRLLLRSNLELFYHVLEESDDCVGIIPDILLKQKHASVSPKLVCREIEPKICSTVGYLIDQEQSAQCISRKFIKHLEAAVEAMRQ
ncbi:MAG: LysR family transcriptional regulator [Peptococcaceae bacterium]